MDPKNNDQLPGLDDDSYYDTLLVSNHKPTVNNDEIVGTIISSLYDNSVYNESTSKIDSLDTSASLGKIAFQNNSKKNENSSRDKMLNDRKKNGILLKMTRKYQEGEAALRLEHKEIQKQTQIVNNKINDQKLSLDISILSIDNNPKYEVLKQDKTGETPISISNQEILKESDCSLSKISDNDILNEVKKPDIFVQKNENRNVDKTGQKIHICLSEEILKESDCSVSKISDKNHDILNEVKKPDILVQNNEDSRNLDKPGQEIPICLSNQKILKESDISVSKISNKNHDINEVQKQDILVQKNENSRSKMLDKKKNGSNFVDTLLLKMTRKYQEEEEGIALRQKQTEIQKQPQINNEIIDQKLDTFLTLDNTQNHQVLKDSPISNCLNHNISIDFKKPNNLNQNDAKQVSKPINKPILMDKMPVNTVNQNQDKNLILTDDTTKSQILKDFDDKMPVNAVNQNQDKNLILTDDTTKSQIFKDFDDKMPVNAVNQNQDKNLILTDDTTKSQILKDFDDKMPVNAVNQNQDKNLILTDDTTKSQILKDFDDKMPVNEVNQNQDKNLILTDDTTKSQILKDFDDKMPVNAVNQNQDKNLILTDDTTKSQILKDFDDKMPVNAVNQNQDKNFILTDDTTKSQILKDFDDKMPVNAVNQNQDKNLILTDDTTKSQILKDFDDKMPVNAVNQNQDKNFILTDDTTKSQILKDFDDKIPENDTINYEKTKTENVIILKLSKDDDNMIISDLKYSTKTCNSIVSEKGTFSFDEVEDKSINFVFNFLKLFNNSETEILYASNNEICQKVSNKIFDFSKLLSVLNQNTLRIPDCLKIAPVEEVVKELLDNKPDITITKIPNKYVETSFNDFEDIYPLENCITVYDQDVDTQKIKNPIQKTTISIAKPIDGELYYTDKYSRHIPIAHMNENHARNMLQWLPSPVDYTIVPKTRKNVNKVSQLQKKNNAKKSNKKSKNLKTNGIIEKNPKFYQICNKPSSSANFVALKNQSYNLVQNRPNFTVKMTKINSHLQNQVKQVMDETIDKVEHQYAKNIQLLDTGFVKPEAVKLPISGIISEEPDENVDQMRQKTPNIEETIADIIENIIKPIEKELLENSICKNKVQQIVDQVVLNVGVHNQESSNVIEEIVISDDEDTIILNSLNSDTPEVIKTREETVSHVIKEPVLSQGSSNFQNSICVEIIDAMLSTVETLCRSADDLSSEEIVISDDEETAILDSTVEIIEAREEIVSSDNEHLLNQNSDTFQNLVCAQVTNMMINKVENCQEIEDTFNNSSNIEEVIIDTTQASFISDQSPEKSLILDKNLQNSENFEDVTALEDNPVNECPIIDKETIQVINQIHSVEEKNDKNQLLCVENSISTNENYFINKLPVNKIKPLKQIEECTKNASAFKIQQSSETIVHSPPPLALKKIFVKSFSNQTDVLGSSYIPPLLCPVSDVQSLSNTNPVPSTSSFDISSSPYVKNVPTIYSKKLKRRVPIDSPDPEDTNNEENTIKADGEKLKPKRLIQKKKTVYPDPPSTRIMKLRNSIKQMAKPIARNNSEDIYDDVPLIERIKINFRVNTDKNEKKSTKKKIHPIDSVKITRAKKPMLDAKAKLRRVRKKLNFDQVTSENIKSQPKLPTKSLLKTKFPDILCSKTKNSNQPISSKPKNDVLKLDNKNETKLNEKSPKSKQKTIVNNILVSNEKISPKNNKKPSKIIKTKIELVTPVLKLVKNPSNKSNKVKSPKILKTKNSDIVTNQENLVVSKLRNNKQFHSNEDFLINSENTSSYQRNKKKRSKKSSNSKRKMLNFECSERLDLLSINTEENVIQKLDSLSPVNKVESAKENDACKILGSNELNPKIDHDPILSDSCNEDKNKVTYDGIHPKKRCAKFSDSSEYGDKAREETPKNLNIDITQENLIVSKLRNNKQFHSNKNFLTNSENKSTYQRNKTKEVLKKIELKKLPKTSKKSSNSKRKMLNLECSEEGDILSISTEENVNPKLNASPVNEIESVKEADTCKILGSNKLNSEVNHNPIIILSDSSDEDKNKVTYDGIHPKKRCAKFSDSSEYEDNVREETPKTKRFMNRVPITYENSDTSNNNNSNIDTPKPIGSKRRKNPKKPIRKSTTFDSAPDLTGETDEKFIEFENTPFKFENPPIEDDSKVLAQDEIESKSETKSTLSNVKNEDEAKSSLNLDEINTENCKHSNSKEIVKISTDTKLDPLSCLKHDRTDENSPETVDVQNQSFENLNFPKETLDTPQIFVNLVDTSPLQNEVCKIVEDLVQLPSESMKTSVVPSNYSHDTVDDFKVINDSHKTVEELPLKSTETTYIPYDSNEEIENINELPFKPTETSSNIDEPIEDLEELPLKSTKTANEGHEVIEDLNELPYKTIEASDIDEAIEDLEESPSKFATTQNKGSDEVIKDLEEAPSKLATTQNNGSEVIEGPTATETANTPQNDGLEELPTETNITPNNSPAVEDPEELRPKPMETAVILDNVHEVVKNVEESSMDIELNHENEEILHQEVKNAMESLLNKVEIEMMKTSIKNDVLIRKCIFEPDLKANIKSHEDGFALKCLMEVLGCVEKSEQESAITEDSTQKIVTIDFVQDKKFVPNENQTVSNIIQPGKQKNCDIQNPFVELLEICTMKNINKNVASSPIFQEQTIFTFTSDNCSESNDNSAKNSEENDILSETHEKKDDIKEAEEENSSDVIIVDSPPAGTTQDFIQVTLKCQDDATMVNNPEENQNIIENVEKIKQDMNIEQSKIVNPPQDILKPVEHLNELAEIYLQNTQDPTPSTSSMPIVEQKLDELEEIYLQNTQDPSSSSSSMPPVEPKLDKLEEIYLQDTQNPSSSSSNMLPVEPKLDKLEEIYLQDTQDPCPSPSNMPPVEPKLDKLEEIYLQNTQDPSPLPSNMLPVEPKLDKLEEIIYLHNTQDPSPLPSNMLPVEPKLDKLEEIIYLHNTQDPSPLPSNMLPVEPKLDKLEEIIYLHNTQDPSSSSSNMPPVEPKLDKEETYLQNTQDPCPSSSNVPPVEEKLDEIEEIYLQNTQDPTPSTSNKPPLKQKLNVLEENAQDSSPSTSEIPTEELDWPSITKACEQYVSLLKRKNRKKINLDKICDQLMSVPEIRLRRLSDLEISKAQEVPIGPIRRRPGRKRKIQATPRVVLKEQKKNIRKRTELSEKRLINNPSSRIRLQPVPPSISPTPQPVLNNFSSRSSQTNNSTACKIKEQRELPPIDVRAEKLKKHLKKNGIKNVDELTKTFKQLIQPQTSQTEPSNFLDTYPENSQIMPYGGNYNPYDSMPSFFPLTQWFLNSPVSNYPPPPMYSQFYQYPQYSQDFQSNQSFQNFYQERHKYPSTSSDTRTNINETNNEESENEDSDNEEKSSLKIVRVESIPHLTYIDLTEASTSSQESHEQNIIQNTKANNRKRKSKDEEDEPERKRPA